MRKSGFKLYEYRKKWEMLALKNGIETFMKQNDEYLKMRQLEEDGYQKHFSNK